jgi:hypothetical protein
MCWLSTGAWFKVWAGDVDEPKTIRTTMSSRPLRREPRKLRVLKVPVPYDRYVVLRSSTDRPEETAGGEAVGEVKEKATRPVKVDERTFECIPALDEKALKTPVKRPSKKRTKVSPLLPISLCIYSGKTLLANSLHLCDINHVT